MADDLVSSSAGGGGASGKRRKFPLRLALFGLAAVAAVAFGFLTHTAAEASALLEAYGYYAIAGTFAWAVVACSQAYGAWSKTQPALVRREKVVLALTVALLSLVAFLSVRYSYKVLYDEYVLQSTAWNMHFFREVGTVVRCYEVNGVFSPLQTYLDKRPVFFAFMVSLVHDLTGYREGNAFYLNTALMPVMLLLAYGLARRVMSHAAGMAAIILLGAFSLVANNAMGAGMEMLNMAMLLLAMHAATLYLDAPDGKRLSALVLLVVLLAQTRYESSLYVAPAAVVVIEGWRRAGRVLMPAAALFAPVLLIPYALHNTYLSGTPMLWELHSDKESRFSLQDFSGNIGHAWSYFFDFSRSLTNSWWLAALGIPALCWGGLVAARHARKWKTANPGVVTLVAFSAGILGNLVLLMFYYWGQLDDPIVARLSLPFSILMAICVGWALDGVPVRWRRRCISVVAGGALVGYLGHGLPVNAQHSDLNMLGLELEWEREVVGSMPPVSRLILTNKSSLGWLLVDTSAIQIGRARFRGAQVKFHLDRHTFQEVLVMQGYRATTADGEFQIDPADRLPAEYVLEPVAERRVGIKIARISRVVEIRLDPPVNVSAK